MFTILNSRLHGFSRVLLLLMLSSLTLFDAFGQFPTGVLSPTDTNYYLITERFDAYFDSLNNLNVPENGTIEEEEDGDFSKYNRWKDYWKSRLDENGLSNGYWEAMRSYLRNEQPPCADPAFDDNIKWRALGPFNSDGTIADSRALCNDFSTQNQGRVVSISVNPNNHDDILVSGSMGIYRTINGGDTWVNTTDDEGLSIGCTSCLSPLFMGNYLIYHVIPPT